MALELCRPACSSVQTGRRYGRAEMAVWAGCKLHGFEFFDERAVLVVNKRNVTRKVKTCSQLW